jgi:sugar phosphate isomerase/epimerase
MPSRLSRRKFLAGIGAIGAAAAVGPRALALPLGGHGAAKHKLPLGFSTLGCPAWSWEKILDFAEQYGFLGVELRGLQGNMDLPTCPEFSPSRLEQSKKDVAAHGLHISSVDTDAIMDEPDPQKQEVQLANARRFIDLAALLDAPYIRVFGNQIVGTPEEASARVAKSLRELGDYAGPKNVTVLIESHGDFVHSPMLLDIFKQADSPHVGLLWDANHTYVLGGEDPAFTVSKVGKYIHHTHLKDSVGKGDQTHYVLTGRGDVPVKEQVQQLVDIGYKGYFSYEWEKAWHPDLEDPSIAFPEYAKVMTQYLKDAYAHRHKQPSA